MSFSTADAVDIRSELTRVVRVEADRLVSPVVALAEQNAIGLVRAVQAETNKRHPSFFCHSLCGPIWMIFDGPKTQHGELF